MYPENCWKLAEVGGSRWNSAGDVTACFYLRFRLISTENIEGENQEMVVIGGPDSKTK
jgi:hypothetical protein